MIEINLIQKKKATRMPHVMGIDLGAFNFKALGVAILFYLFAEPIVEPLLQEQMVGIDQEVSALQSQLTALRQDVDSNKNIQEKLAAYKNKLDILQERSKQVDTIIMKKSNPKLLLEKLARIIPDDMWFSDFMIDEKQNLTIKGGSFGYKSIGSFIADANETLFFNKSLMLGDSKTVTENILGQEIRFEQFEIKGNIVSFSPWAK